jgi:hypothetical protein
MVDISYAQVQPFLPPLNAARQARVTAWLPVLSVILTHRYGDRITDEPTLDDDGNTVPANEPVFLAIVADALERRLARPGLVDQQSVGPASVRYNSRAHLAKWFLPEEISQMDDIAGLGGSIRSVRTPAPDAIRFGNRMSAFEAGDC